MAVDATIEEQGVVLVVHGDRGQAGQVRVGAVGHFQGFEAVALKHVGVDVGHDVQLAILGLHHDLVGVVQATPSDVEDFEATLQNRLEATLEARFDEHREDSLAADLGPGTQLQNIGHAISFSRNPDPHRVPGIGPVGARAPTT